MAKALRGTRNREGHKRETEIPEACPLLEIPPACSETAILVIPEVSASARSQAGLSVIKESEAQLWWAAKELRRTKKLSDYVGKNEKTKIIVKIQQVSVFPSHGSAFCLVAWFCSIGGQKENEGLSMLGLVI